MIQALEELVRAGEIKKAQALIRKINCNEIDRKNRLPFAAIAGRIGLPHLALRILNPVIRGPNPIPPASPEENLQYANLLRKLGAVEEAMEIIGAMDPGLEEARLHLAFCLQTQWRYREAAALLESIVKDARLEPYRLNVAKVNLLAAWVSEDEFDKAEELAERLEPELQQANARLLHGNVLELRAQIDIRRGQLDRALKRLDTARSGLSHAGDSLSGIFIDKWAAIARSLQAHSPAPELIEVEERATRMGHWETVRDCAFYRALTSHDSVGLARLYIGTPYPGFRAKIAATGAQVPDCWDWPEHGESADVFDIMSGVSASGRIKMEPGQSAHRLLLILCQDFFRPVPLLSLFSRLFPGEYFNPNSSPNRIHQILKRFRQLYPEIPIEEMDGAYRLQPTASLALRIPRDPPPMESRELKLLQLRRSLTGAEFTTRDASVILGTSRSATQRLLSWAEQHGQVITLGRKNRSRYRMAA